MVRAPALATLGITDGREGRVEAPVGRSRAFHSWAEETQVPPGAIAGMYHFCFLHDFYMYAFIKSLPKNRGFFTIAWLSLS